MSKLIKIMCVDDHSLLRAGIGAIVSRSEDMELVAEACDGIKAVELFREHRPDVTIMDLVMPNVDGVDTMVAIRREFPDARFVVLSEPAGDILARRAAAAGAAAFVDKSSAAEDLLAAIRAVHRADRITDSAASRLEERVDPQLTDREVKLLELVAQGMPNRDIALAVDLAESTVNNYMKKIFLKLDASDRTHAVTLALKRGVIRLNDSQNE